MRSPPPRPASATRAPRLAAAAWVLGLVFVAPHCEALVPRHSWSREWGPMVPHRTFPMDCGACHVVERWNEIKEEVVFDHGKETGRVLEGAHEQAACLRCHNDRGPVRGYVERGCGGCHVDPHRGALGMTCEECHGQATWEPRGLVADHARTRFPLTGAHAFAQCESCHARATVGDYRGTPAACEACHQEEAGRAFPPHRVNGWVRDCERCHTPAGWTAPGFDHSAFPLADGHAGADCLSCHAGGRFAGTSADCHACHRTDYLGAPGHVAEGRSTRCLDCHRATTWQDVTGN